MELMNIFYAAQSVLLLYYVWRYDMSQPKQPQGCRCAGTCIACRKWKKFVRSRMMPCPFDKEEWYYFDEWNGRWLPRPINYIKVANVKKTAETIAEIKEDLDDIMEKLRTGHDLYTCEKPPQ